MNILDIRHPPGSTPWIKELKRARAKARTWAEEALTSDAYLARRAIVADLDAMLDEEGA